MTRDTRIATAAKTTKANVLINAKPTSPASSIHCVRPWSTALARVTPPTVNTNQGMPSRRGTVRANATAGTPTKPVNQMADCGPTSPWAMPMNTRTIAIGTEKPAMRLARNIEELRPAIQAANISRIEDAKTIAVTDGNQCSSHAESG